MRSNGIEACLELAQFDGLNPCVAETTVRNMINCNKAPWHGFLIILFLFVQDSLMSDTQKVSGNSF